MTHFNQVAVVGCGGIGRSLAILINEYSKRGLEYWTGTQFTLFDPDVVEPENVWTQGFTTQDAMTMVPKVRAACSSFRNPHITGQAVRIESPSQLTDFDAVMLACDNLATRKMVYEHCLNRGTYFVDGRVNGTLLMVVDSNAPRETLLSSVSAGDSESAAPTSCLAAWEKEQRIVHSTPFVVAGIMVQMYLNHIRGHGKTNFPVDLALGGA